MTMKVFPVVCGRPVRRLWLQHAVIMLRDGRSGGLHIIFPIKSVCRAAIMFLTQGIEYNILRTLSLCILCSCNFVMVIWRMRWMLWCKNTLSLSSCDCRRNHVSAPHRSRFIGKIWKRRYLLCRSRWGLPHTLFILPIAAFAAASLAVMSSSSGRL